MRICCLCHKEIGNGLAFFKVPRDERKRRKWSNICGGQLSASSGICEDHFLSSDIIKGTRKALLAPNALPFLQPVKTAESFTSANIQDSDTRDLDMTSNSSLEYVHINTITNPKCRCCIKPSSSFIQLDNYIKPTEEKGKTYKDVLYEITNLSMSLHHEKSLPQQICHTCGAQLKNACKFIQQARRVSQQYLSLIEQKNIQVDMKNIEYLHESLIEMAEVPVAEQSNEEIKIEPLDIDCNMKIKEEKVECETLIPVILKNDEKKDFLQNSNTDDHSSEDEDDSDEPESVKTIDTDLNNELIARCCDICHKVYSNEKFLKVHKRYTHMPEENKLPCPLCTYKASRMSAIKVHMGLVHGHDKVNVYFKPIQNSGKKYPCNLCSCSYARKDSLRKHVRRKHINKPPKENMAKKSKTLKPKEKQRFLCTYCGQSFSSKGGLESHALTHTGERPFSCEICSKSFKRLKDLQLHRVIHSDEKPHQCSECGKAFKRVDKLKIHMRVHSELRPYKCNECEKTFKYPSVLRTHMHIHTGRTPFSCKTCGEAFSLRTSLNNHCLKNGHVK